MKGVGAAAELCRVVGSPSLFEWLDLPRDADAERIRAALRQRRRRLQSQQGNPKHAHVARLVITHYRVLDELLADPAAYRSAVEEAHTLAKLPMVDLGVDGVLADGLVTEEELCFLQDVAARLGLPQSLVLGRLRVRAEARGVSLAPPSAPRTTPGPPHPLLPRDWWTDDVASWLADLVAGARDVVDLRCDRGAVGAGLLRQRPGLRYLGFDRPDLARHAQVLFDAPDLDGATALPGIPGQLPVADGSADVVLSVMHVPDGPELAEARRVAGRGRVILVMPDVPRATLDGPLPALDGALWGLCRAALLTPALPAARRAITHVVTHTVCGDRSTLVALLLSRVAAVQHHAGLSDHHPAIRRVALALEAFADGPSGVGSYQVPLVARVL